MLSCCAPAQVYDAMSPPPDDIDPFNLRNFLLIEAYLLLWLSSRNRPIKDDLYNSMLGDLNRFQPGDSLDGLMNKLEGHIRKAGEQSQLKISPLVANAQMDMGKRVRTQMTFSWTPTVTKWSAADTATMNWLSRNGALFAGKYFDDNLVDKARKILTRDYSLYGDNLAKFKLRVKDGLVPFVEATDRYWEVVATNALNMARSYQAVWALNKTGVRGYRIKAVLDSRTTQICRALDGKEFLVQEAWPMFDGIANAQTIDELTEIKPMVKQNPDGTFSANGTVFDADTPSTELARLGLMFPPFHWACRSTIQPL
jgi:hypothetical protein